MRQCCLMPNELFSTISWGQQVKFDDIRFVLDQMISWIFILLAH